MPTRFWRIFSWTENTPLRVYPVYVYSKKRSFSRAKEKSFLWQATGKGSEGRLTPNCHRPPSLVLWMHKDENFNVIALEQSSTSFRLHDSSSMRPTSWNKFRAEQFKFMHRGLGDEESIFVATGKLGRIPVSDRVWGNSKCMEKKREICKAIRACEGR